MPTVWESHLGVIFAGRTVRMHHACSETRLSFINRVQLYRTGAPRLGGRCIAGLQGVGPNQATLGFDDQIATHEFMGFAVGSLH